MVYSAAAAAAAAVVVVDHVGFVAVDAFDLRYIRVVEGYCCLQVVENVALVVHEIVVVDHIAGASVVAFL